MCFAKHVYLLHFPHGIYSFGIDFPTDVSWLHKYFSLSFFNKRKPIFVLKIWPIITVIQIHFDLVTTKPCRDLFPSSKAYYLCMFIDLIYPAEREIECSTKYLGKFCWRTSLNILNSFCSALPSNQIDFGKLLGKVIFLVLDDFFFQRFIDQKVSYLWQTGGYVLQDLVDSF